MMKEKEHEKEKGKLKSMSYEKQQQKLEKIISQIRLPWTRCVETLPEPTGSPSHH